MHIIHRKLSLTEHQSTYQTTLLFFNLELTVKALESMNLAQNLNISKERNMLWIQTLNFGQHSNIEHSHTLLKLESNHFKLLCSTL